MPLMKSRSKGAFAHNVKAEIAAGKPPKQALAIAYSVKDKAPKRNAADTSAGASGPNRKMELAGHHSAHSAKRSEHYHNNVVAQKTFRGPNKATVARGQLINPEEDRFSDGKL